jgi:hypothetical protein
MDNHVYIYIFKDDENKLKFTILPEDNCEFLGTLSIGNNPQGIYSTIWDGLNYVNGIDSSTKTEVPIKKGFVADIDNNLSTEYNVKYNLEKFFKWIQMNYL